jgi:hypothetical protein
MQNVRAKNAEYSMTGRKIKDLKWLTTNYAQVAILPGAIRNEKGTNSV